MECEHKPNSILRIIFFGKIKCKKCGALIELNHHEKMKLKLFQVFGSILLMVLHVWLIFPISEKTSLLAIILCLEYTASLLLLIYIFTLVFMKFTIKKDK